MNYVLLSLFLLTACYKQPVHKTTSVKVEKKKEDNLWLGHAVHWKDSDLPLKIWVTESLYNRYKNEIIAAIEAWNTEVGCKLIDPELSTFSTDKVYQVLAEGRTYIFIYYNPQGTAAAWALAHTVAGKNRGYIGVRLLWTSKDQIKLFIHEFGHILGLEHDDDQKSIMFKNILNSDQEIMKQDSTALRERYCEKK